MFDISFPELVVVCVIALLVLGPERLPGALRTMGLWVGRISRTFVTMKAEIEREIGMDDIRRQLHNEAVMDEVKRLEREVRGEATNGAKHIEAAAPDSVAPEPHTDASTSSAAPTSQAQTRA